MTAAHHTPAGLEEGTMLAPDFRLPAAIALLGAPLFFVSVWVCGAIELFAIFLSIQTATFAADIHRSQPESLAW